MKIVVVGANGLIGSNVVKLLEKEHQIVKVGSSSGDIICDLRRKC